MRIIAVVIVICHIESCGLYVKSLLFHVTQIRNAKLEVLPNNRFHNDLIIGILSVIVSQLRFLIRNEAIIVFLDFQKEKKGKITLFCNNMMVICNF